MAKKEKFHVILVCPAYNVAATIGELIRRTVATAGRLKNSGATLDAMIVVDDGSSDNTLSMLHSLRKSTPFLVVVHTEKNGGAPRAVLDGMAKASKFISSNELPLETTIVVRMDTDLEHQPEDLPRLLKPITGGRAKICVGYVLFDARSGLDAQEFNRRIGLEESRKFLSAEIPQFAPGFYAMRGDVFLRLAPRLAALSKKFRSQFGTDMVTIDIVCIALASRLGNRLAVVRLRKIEGKWLKKPKESKLSLYQGYHEMTVKFLGKQALKLQKKP